MVKQEPIPQRRMPNSFQRGRCRSLIYQSHPRWRFEGRWLNGPRLWTGNSKKKALAGYIALILELTPAEIVLAFSRAAKDRKSTRLNSSH